MQRERNGLHTTSPTTAAHVRNPSSSPQSPTSLSLSAHRGKRWEHSPSPSTDEEQFSAQPRPRQAAFGPQPAPTTLGNVTMDFRNLNGLNGINGHGHYQAMNPYEPDNGPGPPPVYQGYYNDQAAVSHRGHDDNILPRYPSNSYFGAERAVAPPHADGPDYSRPPASMHPQSYEHGRVYDYAVRDYPIVADRRMRDAVNAVGEGPVRNYPVADYPAYSVDYPPRSYPSAGSEYRHRDYAPRDYPMPEYHARYGPYPPPPHPSHSRRYASRSPVPRDYPVAPDYARSYPPYATAPPFHPQRVREDERMFPGPPTDGAIYLFRTTVSDDEAHIPPPQHKRVSPLRSPHPPHAARASSSSSAAFSSSFNAAPLQHGYPYVTLPPSLPHSATTTHSARPHPLAIESNMPVTEQPNSDGSPRHSGPRVTSALPPHSTIAGSADTPNAVAAAATAAVQYLTAIPSPSAGGALPAGPSGIPTAAADPAAAAAAIAAAQAAALASVSTVTSFTEAAMALNPEQVTAIAVAAATAAAAAIVGKVLPNLPLDALTGILPVTDVPTVQSAAAASLPTPTSAPATTTTAPIVIPQPTGPAGSKRFQCQYCPKRFSRPSSLTTHVYTHTGERPHACTIPGCKRTFSVLSNLRRHTRVCQRNMAKRASGGDGGSGSGRAAMGSPSGSEGPSETDGVFEPKRGSRRRDGDGGVPVKGELEDGELEMKEADDSAGNLANGAAQSMSSGDGGAISGGGSGSGSSGSGSGSSRTAGRSSGSSSSGSGHMSANRTAGSDTGSSGEAGGACGYGSGSDEGVEARVMGKKVAESGRGDAIRMMMPSS
ncbi:hypothetical protein HK101_001900 [Irineochytrium annulatum]|nr:hypothetical protein HK101_001900 [Irineochytrium annulatum]